MEMLADALLHEKPQPERTFTVPVSIPALESLRPSR
jgi:hypothetical protein